MEVDQRYLNLTKVLKKKAEEERTVTPVTLLRSQRPKPAAAANTAGNKSTQATSTVHTPSSDFVPSDTSFLEVGQRVEHTKFGFGKVIKMDINGTDRKAVIHFEKAGEKTLLLSFAKLRILDK